MCLRNVDYRALVGLQSNATARGRLISDTQVLRTVLYFCTVSVPQEIEMRHPHLRYTYSPSAVHLPHWMRRLWSWF